MSERIPWDEYEAVILFDAFLSVEDGLITRNQAFEYVSAALRQKAMLRGTPIDQTFRNINGIRMQLDAMKYIYTNGELGLPHSNKLFESTIELYRTNRTAYREKLSEANRLAGLLLYTTIPHPIR